MAKSNSHWKAVNSEIEGLAQITVNLQHVTERIEREAYRQALRKAARPMVRAAKANARGFEESGTLRRAIGVKVKRHKKKNGGVTVYVGIRTGKSRPGPDGRKRDPSRYGHLAELGRKSRAPYEGEHFLEKAFKSTKGEAFVIWKKEVQAGIPKAIARVMRDKRRK